MVESIVWSLGLDLLLTFCTLHSKVLVKPPLDDGKQILVMWPPLGLDAAIQPTDWPKSVRNINEDIIKNDHTFMEQKTW